MVFNSSVNSGETTTGVNSSGMLGMLSGTAGAGTGTLSDHSRSSLSGGGSCGRGRLTASEVGPEERTTLGVLPGGTPTGSPVGAGLSIPVAGELEVEAGTNNESSSATSSKGKGKKHRRG